MPRETVIRNNANRAARAERNAQRGRTAENVRAIYWRVRILKFLKILLLFIVRAFSSRSLLRVFSDYFAGPLEIGSPRHALVIVQLVLAREKTTGFYEGDPESKDRLASKD